jgi:hypothetical protein
MIGRRRCKVEVRRHIDRVGRWTWHTRIKDSRRRRDGDEMLTCGPMYDVWVP